MRAAIEWSYELHAAKQLLFGRLAVFFGGCTSEAAEEVCEAELDALESLAGQEPPSSIAEATDRFTMLETIREYASEKLGSVDEVEEVGERHEKWVLDFVRAVAPRWGDPAPREQIERLLADVANVRVAVAWAIERGDANTAQELVGLVGRAWMETGRTSELRARAEEALQLGGGDAFPEGMALLTFAVSGDPTQGQRSLLAAAERFRDVGMAKEAGYATMCVGMLLGLSGSVDEALEWMERALMEFERIGDSYLIEVARFNIDSMASWQTSLDPARAQGLAVRFREGLELARSLGDVGDADRDDGAPEPRSRRYGRARREPIHRSAGGIDDARDASPLAQSSRRRGGAGAVRRAHWRARARARAGRRHAGERGRSRR